MTPKINRKKGVPFGSGHPKKSEKLVPAAKEKRPAQEQGGKYLYNPRPLRQLIQGMNISLPSDRIDLGSRSSRNPDLARNHLVPNLQITSRIPKDDEQEGPGAHRRPGAARLVARKGASWRGGRSKKQEKEATRKPGVQTWVTWLQKRWGDPLESKIFSFV